MNVYAFEWCDCIFESGFRVKSLHASKRWAFKAMTAEANRKWQDDRDMMGRGWTPLEHEAWRIRTIEVLP